MNVPLREIAFARCGDKGDTANVGIVPYDELDYQVLLDQVTEGRVAELFGDLVRGTINRYEFTGIKALNFVMTKALGGGVSRSLNIDLHGKSYGSLILRLAVDINPERLSALRVLRISGDANIGADMSLTGV